MAFAGVATSVAAAMSPMISLSARRDICDNHDIAVFPSKSSAASSLAPTKCFGGHQIILAARAIINSPSARKYMSQASSERGSTRLILRQRSFSPRESHSKEAQQRFQEPASRPKKVTTSQSPCRFIVEEVAILSSTQINLAGNLTLIFDFLRRDTSHTMRLDGGVMYGAYFL